MTCIVGWINERGTVSMVGDTMTTIHIDNGSYYIDSVGNEKISKYSIYGTNVLIGGFGYISTIENLKNVLLNILSEYENLSLISSSMFQDIIQSRLIKSLSDYNALDCSLLVTINTTIIRVQISDNKIRCYTVKNSIETIGSGSGLFNTAFKTYLTNDGYTIEKFKDNYLKGINLFPAIEFASNVCKKYCITVSKGNWIGHSLDLEELIII